MSKVIEKLDENICIQFRHAICESPTISHDREKGFLYNLACAVKDRLYTAIRFLNNHWDYPDSEEDFLCFLLFACMLNDGIDSIYKAVFNAEPICNQEKKRFKEYIMRRPTYFSDEECPSDMEFFKHLRAAAFAHPYETKHNKAYKNLFGVQVSPWVVVNKYILPFYDFNEPIGVRIYSSTGEKGEDVHDIMFSFDALKEFLKEKYSLLCEVTRWFKEDAKKTYEEWMKDKINRTLAPIDILRDVCRVLNKHHESTYAIETMIRALDLPISDDRNKEFVEEYRGYLVSLIPQLCDCVDKMDSAGQYEIERKTHIFYPLGMHEMANYQLEKVFNYLQERHLYVSANSNEEWGLQQAEGFYIEFAKKWVMMDVRNMDYNEIKLLFIVAMFKECKEQGRLSIR